MGRANYACWARIEALVAATRLAATAAEEAALEVASWAVESQTEAGWTPRRGCATTSGTWSRPAARTARGSGAAPSTSAASPSGPGAGARRRRGRDQPPPAPARAGAAGDVRRPRGDAARGRRDRGRRGPPAGRPCRRPLRGHGDRDPHGPGRGGRRRRRQGGRDAHRLVPPPPEPVHRAGRRPLPRSRPARRPGPRHPGRRPHPLANDLQSMLATLKDLGDPDDEATAHPARRPPAPPRPRPRPRPSHRRPGRPRRPGGAPPRPDGEDPAPDRRGAPDPPTWPCGWRRGRGGAG